MDLLFKCPDLFGDDLSLPYDQLQEQIEETLRAQIDSESIVAFTLLFLTCNQKDKEKLDAGKEIICKYMENIIANPNEEKFRRIRLQNKVYIEVNRSIYLFFLSLKFVVVILESRIVKIRF